MDWLWHALVVCVVIIPTTVLWLAILIEVIRRQDLGGATRTAWIVAILVLPVLGSFVYITVTWLCGPTRPPNSARHRSRPGLPPTRRPSLT